MTHTFLRYLSIFCLAALVAFAHPAVGTVGAAGLESASAEAAQLKKKRGIFKTCPVNKRDDATFALCATATCWMLDGVAYCKCEILEEESISLTFRYREKGEKKDVCDLLQAGLDNGFTVSTYATPRQTEANYDRATEKLGPPLALYNCPGQKRGTSGFSAQCDGGLCFKSTSGQDFPGLGKIKNDEIVCSCPTAASPPIGFQITGPWNCAPGDRNVDGRCCDEAYRNKLCNVNSVTKTGTEIAVGAPTGVATFLSKLLDGKAPKINRCLFK